MNTKTDELWAERINQRMKEARNAALREAAAKVHSQTPDASEIVDRYTHGRVNGMFTARLAILALIEKDEP